MLVKKVHSSIEEFHSLISHPLLEEGDHLQSLFNVLDQFESAIIHAATVDDHYDEVEQQLKRTEREKIESEQSVKQTCTRIMVDQPEEEQQQEREQQLSDLLQSTTITKRDHLRSEYKQQLERILTEETTT